MESESKKRKMDSHHAREEEENEEETMEKFFALIRSTKEARDRLKSNGDNGSKQKEEEKPVLAAWNPSFEPEDFMDDARLKSPLNSQAGPSNTEQHNKKAEEEEEEEEEQQQQQNSKDAKEEEEKERGSGGHGLDLNLSL